jgi:glycosyltransferase involved in cell wall biosynthesis
LGFSLLTRPPLEKALRKFFQPGAQAAVRGLSLETNATRETDAAQMKISYIAAGAGGMICGNCLRDTTLTAALTELGLDVEVVPTYTPIRTDEGVESSHRVFYGGINVFLQQKSAIFRHTPAAIDWIFDRPALLRWVSRIAVKTEPQDLGALTVSVLEGADGLQRKELEKLIHWLRESRPRLVHLTNSMLAGIAPALKAEIGAPVVCSLQGEDYFLTHLPQPYQQQAVEALRRQVASVDCFIAPCRDHAAAMAPLLGIAESEIRIVRPGLNLHGFEERLPRNPDEFVIGYLARISPEKGLHRLAEAFQEIRGRRGDRPPRCKLRVAGWLGPEHVSYLKQVEQTLEQSGLGSDFEYLGNIDRAEKLRFLRGLDVLSVPVSYRAPKGAYVLEAWASGVPVVQTRIGAFPELLESVGGGLLCEPENPRELAASIEQLIDCPEQAREMGLRGRQAVYERFHSKRLAEETAAVYRELVS